MMIMAMARRFSTPLLAAGLALAACFCVPVPAAAEELGRPVKIVDPGGHALDRFHAALRLAEKGKGRARILFLGDSHLARDHYPGMLRASLQKRFGDGGAGFVPLAAAFSHYRHSDVRVAHLGDWQRLRARGGPRARGYFGVHGVAVKTAVKALGFVEHLRRKGRGSRANWYDLYYLQQPGGGSLDIRVDGGEPRRVSTAGTAPQPAFEKIRVSDGPHRYEVQTLGDGPVRIFGVSAERMRPGVIIDTLGVPGARVRDRLPGSAALRSAHLRRLSPHLVVLAYGTNESGDHTSIRQYERELRAVLDRVQKALPRSACLLIGPTDMPEQQPDGSWAARDKTTAIVEVQRRVAGERGCGFFDLLAFMGGPGSMPRWVQHDPPLAREDHVHLTKAGHKRLAAVLERALLQGYQELAR